MNSDIGKMKLLMQTPT